MKICKTCQQLKDLTNFYVSYRRKGKEIYHSQCKSCSTKRTIQYRKNNKEKGYSACIKYLYGITLEDYNRMLKEQNNSCKICKKSETHKNKKRFNIDHDHITGKVRGLLCNRCNVGLGKFLDNQELLLSAVEYLKCQN